MESAGLLLQMDGGLHRWFGGTTSYLIALIDDSTFTYKGSSLPPPTAPCLLLLFKLLVPTVIRILELDVYER